MPVVKKAAAKKVVPGSVGKVVGKLKAPKMTPQDAAMAKLLKKKYGW